MVSGKQILDIACKELGTKEQPTNRVKYNTWYYGKEVSGSQYPWCMAFVLWCYDQAGMPLPFKTASCGAMLRWYKANQPECIVKEPVKGCLVIFDLPNTASLTDHVGLFESMGGGYITTIDGNTSVQNDANGGYVNRRTRKKNWVHAYIKPRGLVEMTSEEILNTLTSEDAYALLLKANEYASKMATPEWMKDELSEAVKLGITDGTRPLATTQRGADAIMAKRAYEKAKADVLSVLK